MTLQDNISSFTNNQIYTQNNKNSINTSTPISELLIKHKSYSLNIHEAETGLECYFKPTHSKDTANAPVFVRYKEEQNYTIIDLLQHTFELEWEDMLTTIRVSDRVRLLGPNTEKRLTRWAQFNRKGRPQCKTIRRQLKNIADQINTIYSEYPGAFQDLTRQSANLNWGTATSGDGLVSAESLWVLIHYGRLNNAPSDNKGGRITPLPDIPPNAHRVEIIGKHCEASILQADDWTMYKHFEAGLNAAYQAALSILSSTDYNILKLWHHEYRNGLRPDSARIIALIGKACFGTFYCLNGERLYIPHHIGREIQALFNTYIHKLVDCIDSRTEAAGIELVERPVLRDELRYIELWPKWPDKEERDKNLIIARGTERRGNEMERFIDSANRPTGNDIYGEWAPTQTLSFDSIDSFDMDGIFNTNPFMYIEEHSLSAVTGIDWSIVGNYAWAEPTEDNTNMVITDRDFNFETKINDYVNNQRNRDKWVPPMASAEDIRKLQDQLRPTTSEPLRVAKGAVKANMVDQLGLPEPVEVTKSRGQHGREAISLNRTKESLYAHAKRIEEVFNIELSNEQIYTRKQLIDFGLSDINLKRGLKLELFIQPKWGTYRFNFIGSDEYLKWREEREAYDKARAANPRAFYRTLKNAYALDMKYIAPFSGSDIRKKFEIAEKETRKGVDVQTAMRNAEKKLAAAKPKVKVEEKPEPTGPKMKAKVKGKTANIPSKDLEILLAKQERGEELTADEQRRLPILKAAEARRKRDYEKKLQEDAKRDREERAARIKRNRENNKK